MKRYNFWQVIPFLVRDHEVFGVYIHQRKKMSQCALCLSVLSQKDARFPIGGKVYCRKCGKCSHEKCTIPPCTLEGDRFFCAGHKKGGHLKSKSVSSASETVCV